MRMLIFLRILNLSAKIMSLQDLYDYGRFGCMENQNNFINDLLSEISK